MYEESSLVIRGHRTTVYWIPSSVGALSSALAVCSRATSTCSSGIFLVGQLLFYWDSQAVDTQELTNAANDQICPSKVNNQCEHQVSTEIPQLNRGAQGRKSNSRQVRKNGSAN